MGVGERNARFAHHPLEPKVQHRQRMVAVFFFGQKQIIAATGLWVGTAHGLVNAHGAGQGDHRFVVLFGGRHAQAQIGIAAAHHLHMLVLQNFDVAGPHKAVDHEHHHPIQVGRQGLVALGDPKPAACACAHLEHGRLGPAARKVLGTAQHGLVLRQGKSGTRSAIDVDFGQLGQLADPLARKRQFEHLAHDHQVLRQRGGRRAQVAQTLDQLLHSVGVDQMNRRGAHQGQDVKLQAVAQNAH